MEKVEDNTISFKELTTLYQNELLIKQNIINNLKKKIDEAYKMRRNFEQLNQQFATTCYNLQQQHQVNIAQSLTNIQERNQIKWLETNVTSLKDKIAFLEKKNEELRNKLQENQAKNELQEAFQIPLQNFWDETPYKENKEKEEEEEQDNINESSFAQDWSKYKHTN